ncbi:hypothetical protein J1N35_028821, partial [Gossypium stocksii]
YDLIFTLVERWHPETHTFHLPYGECTIILEDVVLQLGLPIDGSTIMGVRANFKHLPIITIEWGVMCAAQATNPGTGRSYTVLIYHLMIKTHTGEGIVEWYNGD